MSKKIIFIDGWFLKPPLRGIGIYLKNILISMPKDIKDLEGIDNYFTEYLVKNMEEYDRQNNIEA